MSAFGECGRARLPDPPRRRTLRLLISEEANNRNNSFVSTVVVVSPGDVNQERDLVLVAIEEVNRTLEDANVNMTLRLRRWETDVLPGFDPDGPQARVDAYLGVADADILVGIFWKRFGTLNRDGLFCTEHVIRLAYDAWKINAKPQIIVYFKQQPSMPASTSEAEQLVRVLAFQDELVKLGILAKYEGADEFERKLRQHLRKFAFETAFNEGRANHKGKALRVAW